jgi:hypothetical protein
MVEGMGTAQRLYAPHSERNEGPNQERSRLGDAEPKPAVAPRLREAQAELVSTLQQRSRQVADSLAGAVPFNQSTAAGPVSDDPGIESAKMLAAGDTPLVELGSPQSIIPVLSQRIAIVGGGPRGVLALRSLAESANNLLPGDVVHIHLFDPRGFGLGVHHDTNAAYLITVFQASEISMFAADDLDPNPDSEPPRESRRLFCLSHTPMVDPANCA